MNKNYHGQFRNLNTVLHIFFAVVFIQTNLGCRSRESDDGEKASAKSNIILASTTSTEDTGLFRILIPSFEQEYPGYSVNVIAVGSGKALALGRAGDVDILLVHSRADEDKFMAEGYGYERRDLMYNDFIIVGPPTDPAGIKGMQDAVEALKRISETESRFISRGDNSGTHKKEMEILQDGEIEKGNWRLSVGQGMGVVLTMTDEMQAYTLSDRGTYLAQKRFLEMEIMVEGDERLYNPYGLITLKDARNLEGAKILADWMTSSGIEIIREFGVEKYGRPLFIPMADKTKE